MQARGRQDVDRSPVAGGRALRLLLTLLLSLCVGLASMVSVAAEASPTHCPDTRALAAEIAVAMAGTPEQSLVAPAGPDLPLACALCCQNVPGQQVAGATVRFEADARLTDYAVILAADPCGIRPEGLLDPPRRSIA